MNTEEKKSNDDKLWWRPSLILFTRLSGWIGGPIIIALFLGRWLDQRYNTEPWLFLATVGTAFIASSVGIVKEATVAMKEMEKMTTKEKKERRIDKKS